MTRRASSSEPEDCLDKVRRGRTNLIKRRKNGGALAASV